MNITRRQFLKAGAAGIATSCLIGVYATCIERYLIQVNTYRIPVPNLPIGFEDFTVVQLTDIHYGFLMPKTIVQEVVDIANSIKKDIVVCTGDYIQERNSTRQINAVWPILSKLEAECGVFSVLGNHDHWADFERSEYWLDKTGQNIRHRSYSFKRNGNRIWLGGAGDLWEDAIGIDKAFLDVPEEECKIVLAHNPDTADCQFTTRIDLMISGHTHGGQINIPLIGPPVLPVKNKKYSSGFTRTGKTNLYISKGIGSWAVFPARFNCRPEISVLKLTADNKI